MREGRQRFAAIRGIEQRHFCGGLLLQSAVSHLSDTKVGVPVILLGVDVWAQHHLKNQVDVLDLTVTTGMVSGSGQGSSAKEMQEVGPSGSHVDPGSVRDYLIRHSPIGEDAVYGHVGECFFREAVFGEGDADRHLGEATDIDHDRVVALGSLRELDDSIDRDRGEQGKWDS
jgi:hypothetical protein